MLCVRGPGDRRRAHMSGTEKSAIGLLQLSALELPQLSAGVTDGRCRSACCRHPCRCGRRSCCSVSGGSSVGGTAAVVARCRPAVGCPACLLWASLCRRWVSRRTWEEVGVTRMARPGERLASATTLAGRVAQM